MGNLKERESRRKASVVGSIIEQPAEETKQRSAGRGRPKEDRELRKRVSLSVLPSLYEDIQKIAQTVHNWQKGGNYEDTAGFCRSAKLDEIRKNDYILTPGRYVGTVRDESDNLTFAEKMKPLVAEYNTQLKEAAILDAKIKANLLSLGFEVK